jgi:hypothetical protein
MTIRVLSSTPADVFNSNFLSNQAPSLSSSTSCLPHPHRTAPGRPQPDSSVSPPRPPSTSTAHQTRKRSHIPSSSQRGRIPPPASALRICSASPRAAAPAPTGQCVRPPRVRDWRGARSGLQGRAGGPVGGAAVSP